MKLGHINAAFEKNIREMGFKKILAMMIVPLIIVAIFGLAFEKGWTQDLPVYVVNLDSGFQNLTIADSIIHMIDTRGALSIEEIFTIDDLSTDPVQTAIDAVNDGDARAAIIFSSNFSRDLILSFMALGNEATISPAGLTVFVDGTNPSIPGLVLGETQADVMNVLAAQFGLMLPVKITSTTVYGEGADMRDFMAPGIFGLIVFLVTLLPAMTSQGKNSEMRRKMSSTPLTTSEMFAGDVLSYGSVGVAQATVVLIGGLVMFPEIMCIGSVILVLGILWLLVIASQGLGFLLSAAGGDNPQKIMPILPLLFYPAILLSGLILPIDTLPAVLLPFSYVFPLTYAIESSRDVMIRGWDVTNSDVTLYIVGLIAYALLSLSLAYLLLRRRDARGQESDPAA